MQQAILHTELTGGKAATTPLSYSSLRRARRPQLKQLHRAITGTPRPNQLSGRSTPVTVTRLLIMPPHPNTFSLTERAGLRCHRPSRASRAVNNPLTSSTPDGQRGHMRSLLGLTQHCLRCAMSYHCAIHSVATNPALPTIYTSRSWTPTTPTANHQLLLT